MARQPEGRLVAWLLIELRSELGGQWFKIVADDKPYGEVGIPDILGCHKGRFVAIEVKQPGELPSPRQALVLGRIQQAGGIAKVVDSRDSGRRLIKQLRGGDARRTLTK